MPNITLENDALQLVIRPELGAGVVAFRIRDPSGEWFPLWREGRPDATFFNDLASYTLAPWCNRIRSATFDFEGGRHVLRPDWKDGTAIHGIVKDAGHQILDRTPLSARFRFDSREVRDANFPFAFTCETRYELSGSTLVTDCRVIAGESRMPAAIGFHPYFRRKLWNDRDQIEVRVPSIAASPRGLVGRYQCKDMIPFGPAVEDDITRHLTGGKPLGLLALDEVFRGGLNGGEVRWPASGVVATFSVSEELGHTVIYTGRPDSLNMPDSFCLEPVSSTNDAFNLLHKSWQDTGVRVLDPGAHLSVSWSLSISR